MFERFTDRARRVVVFAQEEARLLDHNYIGTEHLLLGMIHEGEGVAAAALESLGVRLEAVRAEVEEIIGRGGLPVSGHIPFTPRAKKVLELSLRESMQLGHNYIGTEHILLGLIREGEGVAAQVLVKLGADLATTRSRVLALLSGEEVPQDPPRPPTAWRSTAAARLVWGGTGPVLSSTEARCLLCGRPEDKVDYLVGARGVMICDRCIQQAQVAVNAARSENREDKHIRIRPEETPPQDRSTAEEEIRKAFETLILSDSLEDRLAALEDGEALRATAEEVNRRAPGRVVADVEVMVVRFVDEDEAQVNFVLYFGQTPMPRSGFAVRVEGKWKVSRDTWCELVRPLGVPCPPRRQPGEESA